MLFYNWHISAGNYCAPTPVKLKGISANGNTKTNQDHPFAYQSGNHIIVEGVNAGRGITVADLSGKVVATRISRGENIVIDTSYWNKGIYLVEGVKVVVR